METVQAVIYTTVYCIPYALTLIAGGFVVVGQISQR